MTVDELMAALASATEGLTYPSETDAAVVPVRYVRGEALPWEGEGALVEGVEPEAFFAALRETDGAARFHSLHQLLWGAVVGGGLKVYRVGQVEVGVYVVVEVEGEVVGVRTRSVET